MKYSIRTQLTCIISGLVVGTIILCLIVNNFFLEKFYLHNKQNALLHAYEYVNSAALDDTLASDDFDVEFRKICGKNNISYIVLDTDTETVKTSINDYELLSRELLNKLFGVEEGAVVSHIMDDDSIHILITEESHTRTEFLEMWGVLDNGNLFLLQSPLESIKNSVALANRFITVVGFAAAIFAVILGLVASKKITDPIKQLTEISGRMKEMNFEAKYTGTAKTEIAELGNNINELSHALESTISELKNANNELQRDIEKKDEIDEARREFLSNVSHELKTPIALIEGYAEGLKEGISSDPESMEYYCDVIIDESAKMNNLVKNLLSLNQMEQGKDNLNFERFDVVALIDSILQNSDILIKQSEVELRMTDYEPIYVWADQFKTEEVIMNYLSNALHFVDEEKVIEIKLEKNDRELIVSVFNTGSPIDDEALPFIWDKFYKVDKARTREYGGSGIGLSIVKAIADSMHQRCGVNNYDNGVSFWFTLELA